MNLRRIALWTARAVAAAVFLYAGVVKLGASEKFAITVAQFSVLPPDLVNAFARGLPFLETFAAVLLLVPRTSRLGAVLIAGMLAGFMAALAWALSQGLTVDCGCFGGEDPLPSRDKMIFALARDAGLLALTLLLARPNRRPPPEPRTR